MAKKYYKDHNFVAWLETEIHPIYKNNKKIVPYKPPLEAGFVLTLAKKSAQKSYKKDYTNWQKNKGKEKLLYRKHSWME